MHVLLTDVLTCPRCGPDFGLVLLADDVRDRRVLEGWLGCANCRERYRVEHGVADLRYGREAEPAAEATPELDAVKMAALMGITDGPALVLVAGAGAAVAGSLADLVPDLEVIAAAAVPVAAPERSGVSRIVVAQRLPIRTGSMRAVALTGAITGAGLAEAARVAAPRARVVITSGAAEHERQLADMGLRVLARDPATMVAERALF